MSGTIPPDPPIVGRTITQEGLANDIRTLTAHIQEFKKAVWPHDGRLKGIEDRLAVIEDTTGEDVIKFIREAGGRYTEVHSAVAAVASRVEDLAGQLQSLSADIRKRHDDLDDRIGATEQRGATHEVRLNAIDDNNIDMRLRAVEQHVAGDARELALTNKQQRGLDKRTTVISAIVGGVVGGLAKLIGG